MPNFDLKNTELPKLQPLKESFSCGDYEDEYRNLFLEAFETLAPKFFDVSVLGAAHLGSLNLVRKAINNDGLVMLEGDTEEVNTRRIYRAWMARDNQGRGMHFLRAYLQLLFPNVCYVDQLWQKKDVAYPLQVVSKRSDPQLKITKDQYFLTSRIEVSLDPNVDSKSVQKISAIVRSIIPARLVPNFRFYIVFLLQGKFSPDWRMTLEKDALIQQQWFDLYIEPILEDAWNLGDDYDLAHAPVLQDRRVLFGEQLEKDINVNIRLFDLYIEPILKDAWNLGDDYDIFHAVTIDQNRFSVECKVEK